MKLTGIHATLIHLNTLLPMKQEDCELCKRASISRLEQGENLLLLGSVPLKVDLCEVRM